MERKKLPLSLGGIGNAKKIKRNISYGRDFSGVKCWRKILKTSQIRHLRFRQKLMPSLFCFPNVMYKKVFVCCCWESVGGGRTDKGIPCGEIRYGLILFLPFRSFSCEIVISPRKISNRKERSPVSIFCCLPDCCQLPSNAEYFLKKN